MEEIQKKTRKVNKTNKIDETTKEKAVTKKPRATTSTKKETTTVKKESKTPKEETVKLAKTAAKSPKTEKKTTKKTTVSTAKAETKTGTAKKETKTTAKKDTKTSKASTAKKETKESKNKKVEETQKREEPKLTIIREKKEQPVQENESASKKQIKKVKEATTKKEEKPKEKKVKKAPKNYIDISVGAIIVVAIIIGLIIVNVKLGTRAYNQVTKNEPTNSEVETDNDISVIEEVGNVLNNSDELVTELKEKITFEPNVTASIYEEKTFNTNTISNDLKLRLGWATTAEGKKLKSKNENKKDIEAIEKETMEESIKSFFGPNAKYIDESFDNTNVTTFSVYSQNQGEISYSNGIYTSIVSENIETGMAPLIYQEMQKVVKYTDKVIVYVKASYMDVEEEKYIVYKDFNEGEFKERLTEVTSEELFQEEHFNQNTGEGTVSVDTNTSLDSIRNQLDTYKYTFSLDEQTGKYYLTKFNKALSL